MPFNRFLAFGSYVFDILVLYRVYSSTCSLLFFVWVLPIWSRTGFKKLDLKTIGCSIQPVFFGDQCFYGHTKCGEYERFLRRFLRPYEGAYNTNAINSNKITTINSMGGMLLVA